MNGWHNLVHIASGALGLALGSSRTARGIGFVAGPAGRRVGMSTA